MQVREKHNQGIAWKRAIDEARVERLIQKYKKNGELDSEDPALLMLKRWPLAKQFQDNTDSLPSLEQLVKLCVKYGELWFNLLLACESCGLWCSNNFSEPSLNMCVQALDFFYFGAYV